MNALSFSRSGLYRIVTNRLGAAPNRKTVLDRVGYLQDRERMFGVERVTRRALLSFGVPAWMGAGIADCFRHRKTHIETTAGTHEALIVEATRSAEVA